MNPWHIGLAMFAVVLAPFGLRWLHRVLLRLEDRGHIYYLRRKPQSGAMSALTVLHEMVDPGHRHVREARQHIDVAASQSDLLLARLLSLLQADTIDVEAIRDALRQSGTAAPTIYAEAMRIVGTGNTSRIAQLPALIDVLPGDEVANAP